MHRAATVGLLLSLLVAGVAWAQAAEPNPPACQGQVGDANAVDAAIKSLQDKAAGLESYQAWVDYVTKQPLLDSQARRKGILYYAKRDGRSRLRIEFLSLQQDDEPEQKYVEQFLFDGVWLTIVNHQTQRVEKRQMAEPNQPVDAFSLASKHIPVLGFSKMEDLRKQFDVAVVEEPNDPAGRQHLCLTVRPGSAYKDDYTKVHFWVDPKIGLPARIEAVTTEEDVHEIRLIDPSVNRGVDPKAFELDVPRGFTQDVIPLDKNPEQQ